MRYRYFNQVKTILALSGLIVCFALVARWLTLQDQNVVHAAIATSAPMGL